MMDTVLTYVMLGVVGLAVMLLLLFRTKVVIKAAIMALGIAAWNLFGLPAYQAWIESQGKAMGFGETAFGYFIAILVSWGAASLVSRRFGEEDAG
ncbi:hypothetical protein DRO19_00590 [Candidatus Bathyarchaeota archaeon]|nr:MAG: hypothetical protein DRO19_00590 [Candidatus Bathyarchaeota archaeon]